MEFTEKSVVSAPLSTFLRLSRVAGISPLHMVKTGNGFQIRFSTGWAVYGYIMITVINAMTIVLLVVQKEDFTGSVSAVHSQVKTQRVVGTVQNVCMVLVSGAAVYAAPRLMRSMILCLNQMREINSKLNIRHWPKCMERNTICLIGIQALVCLTLSVLNCVQVLLTTVERNQQNFDQDKAALLSTKMINVVHKYKRFDNDLNTLSDIGNTDSAIIDSKYTSTRMAVKRLSMVFSALCEVVREVNRSHGPVVLMMLANFYLHLTCTPYHLIVYLLDGEQGLASYTFLRLLIQLLWCLFHIFNLLTIVEPCHLTHAEAMKTKELVVQMMRYTRSGVDPLATELDQLLKYIVFNQVFYEPLKMFKMTRTLIFTFLGSITTYTIFILHL